MYSQYRQSPKSRGQRSNKGFKVKHGLLLILLLGVGIWLLYQAQRSYKHNKDKSLGQAAHVSEQLRLGRKDRPDLGDAVARTRDSSDHVKMKEDGKTLSGEIKGDDEDGRIQTLRWSSDGEEKMMGMKQNTGSNESGESVDLSEEKQANISAFSDETFASHTQNETDDNLGARIEKGETGADSYQSDSNADPMLKTGDSTTFSDTNGSEEANLVQINRPPTSRTNEKSESEKPHTSSHNSSSQQLVTNNSEAQKSRVIKEGQKCE